MAQVWILRSLRVDVYEQLAFERDLVAMGWAEVGDLALLQEKAQIHDAVRAAFPFIRRDLINDYSEQLAQFRSVMNRGDLILLLRRSSPEVAVGHVTGEYRYRDDLTEDVKQVRSVRWVRTDLPRSSVEGLLAQMPVLTMIFRVPSEEDSAKKVALLLETGASSAEVNDSLAIRKANNSLTPFDNLKRNLDYARSLATAGHHLEQLKVGSFEVPDVYRAAWVQGVAALDYWVRQEVRSRMLQLAQRPSAGKPKGFSEFEIPLSDIESLLQSRTSLATVLDAQLTRTRGHLTYQNPNKIREAFMLVSDVTDLWAKVANILSGRAGEPPVRGNDVQQQLSAIVRRRNKIAHEYDEDPDNFPKKRPIDSAMVTQTIDWIEELAAAILVVLDN